jgi:hypothetical protein
VLFDMHLDAFLVRSLAKDPRYEPEREQAIRLFRHVLECTRGHITGSGLEAVCRAVVAVAEHAEDVYRNLCLETLCELAVWNVELLVKSGSIRVLLQVMVEGPGEISDSVVMAIFYILNCEHTRKYIRPSVDIELLICNFTDNYNRGQAAAEQIHECALTLKAFLTSWTGLVYLCMDDRKSIKSIVMALNSPIAATKASLIELLADVFEVPTSDDGWKAEQAPYDRLEFAAKRRMIRPWFLERSDLVDHHIAALLLVFVECGLLESLVQLIESSDDKMAHRAHKLVARILKLSSKVLPAAHASRIKSLPKLFELATTFQNQEKRHHVISALEYIDATTSDSAAHAKSGKKNAKHDLYREIQVDEAQVRLLIQETMVLAEKEYSRWNWDLISELFQTFLRNPMVLNDTIRNTSFVKRVLSFFRPASNQFSDLLLNRFNLKFLHIGCQVMKTLTSCMEGVKYLHESGLFKEIAVWLSLSIPENNENGVPLLDHDRMNRSLAWGYFWMLMTACQTKEGLRLLEKSNVFDIIFHLTELTNREDIIREILSSMDYTIDGYPRIVLSKMLTVDARETRLMALIQLRTLLHMRVPGFRDWGMRMLVDQLYDIDAEVCKFTVDTLDEACSYPENLEALIRLRPVLDHLGEMSKPLFLRFLSSPLGFQHILDMEFIYDEMDHWLETQNLEYVTMVEISIARGLDRPIYDDPNSSTPSLERRCFLCTFRTEGITPPHFFGALVRTLAGCETLRKRGHVKAFASLVRQPIDGMDHGRIMRLKSILWALGNIGTSELGLSMLEEESIVADIVQLASTCDVLSIRGTCYYVLGLIARTVDGMELLKEFKWEPAGPELWPTSGGASVPTDIQTYLTIPEWTFATLHFSKPRITIKDSVFKDVIRASSNLANHILANAGSKILAKHAIAFSLRCVGSRWSIRRTLPTWSCTSPCWICSAATTFACQHAAFCWSCLRLTWTLNSCVSWTSIGARTAASAISCPWTTPPLITTRTRTVKRHP